MLCTCLMDSTKHAPRTQAWVGWISLKKYHGKKGISVFPRCSLELMMWQRSRHCLKKKKILEGLAYGSVVRVFGSQHHIIQKW